MKSFKSLYRFGGRCLKIRDVCMDFEPYFKVHNLVSVHLKSIILPSYLGHVRLRSIRNKNNWNNASKRLFGSYSHSGIPGFPYRLFCSQEQNSRNIFRNIFLFRNIPNERALNQMTNLNMIFPVMVSVYRLVKI